MNKKEITGIAVGGLLHDIGKFAERSSLYAKGSATDVKKLFWRHHAFQTDQVMAELFPESTEKTISHEVLGTSSLRHLAARHHCPGNKLQCLIQCGDGLAAGHERQRKDPEAKQYSTADQTTKDQQPLISILSRINLPEFKTSPPGHDRHYRIQVPCLKSDDLSDSLQMPDSMHPCPGSEYQSTAVQTDYPIHWRNFVKALKPNPDAPSPFDLIDNFDTILEICRLYQWCLPETTRRQDLSDVALFEQGIETASTPARPAPHSYSETLT